MQHQALQHTIARLFLHNSKHTTQSLKGGRAELETTL